MWGHDLGNFLPSPEYETDDTGNTVAKPRSESFSSLETSSISSVDSIPEPIVSFQLVSLYILLCFILLYHTFYFTLHFHSESQHIKVRAKAVT
mgnify:CR=1 FL=1